MYANGARLKYSTRCVFERVILSKPTSARETIYIRKYVRTRTTIRGGKKKKRIYFALAVLVRHARGDCRETNTEDTFVIKIARRRETILEYTFPAFVD